MTKMTPVERARSIPIEDRQGHPLIGCCFAIRHKGDVIVQGYVRAIVPSGKGDFALVQFFEAALGDPSTMALVSVDEMTGNDPAHEWVWFENDKHLRAYVGEDE